MSVSLLTSATTMKGIAHTQNDVQPSDYEALLPPKQPTRFHSDSEKRRLLAGVSWLLLFALAISLLINVAVLNALYQQPSWPRMSQKFYSPVRHLTTYRPRIFTTGLGSDTTIYQSTPSAAKFSAWRALYVHSVRLTRSEAAQLPNKTLPIQSHSPDQYYMAGINVFHHLHCLHLISQTLDFLFHPDYYGLNATNNPFDGYHSLQSFNEYRAHGQKTSTPQDPFLEPMHIGHCVDSLRQALMCNADTSTYVWQPSPGGKGGVNTFINTQHMCVNFAALRDWAGRRRAEQDRICENNQQAGCDGYVTKMEGQCGYGDSGCGNQFFGAQDSKSRESMSWLDSNMWKGEEGEEGDGNTKIFFETTT